MEHLAEFQRLFEGRKGVYGVYIIDEDLSSRQKKIVGKAFSRKYPHTDEDWINHLEGRVGIGMVPIRDDQCCVFAAIDIDEYDLDHKKLNKEVQDKKLPFVLCRTKSGGAHLYCFFKEPAPASMVRDKLKEFAEALGYPSVEIFPKQREIKEDDIGNWINLPYFDHKAPTVRYGLDKEGKALQTLAEFIEYAKSAAVDPDAFFALKAPAANKEYSDGPPCLQRLTERGFPQGTRNSGLFNIGIYLRLKYPDDWADKLEEANLKHMDPPLKSGEVQQIIKSLKKPKFFYKCQDEPCKSFCSREACLGRRYGVGNGDDEGGDLEQKFTSLQKSFTRDENGNEVLDDKPVWFVTYDGIQIRMSTDELWSQDRFSKRIGETLLKKPDPVNSRRWHEILKSRIENAEKVEYSAESTRYGSIVGAIRDFCTNHGGAEIRTEIDTGMVWRDENGYLWFRHNFLWDFLVRRNIYRASSDGKDLHEVLKSMGAERKQLMIDSKRNINRYCWRLKDWAEERKDVMPEIRTPNTEF